MFGSRAIASFRQRMMIAPPPGIIRVKAHSAFFPRAQWKKVQNKQTYFQAIYRIYSLLLLWKISPSYWKGDV